MALVVVERVFDGAVDADALQAQEDAHAWCLEAHRVTFRHTYVASDGSRMVCVYEAPDAESVRKTQQTADMPFERVWAATPVHSNGTHAVAEPSVVVVERTLPQAVTAQALAALVAEKGWCLEQYGVALLASYLSADGLRDVCAFRAPDAESVRRAQRSAALPVDLAWPGTLILAAPR